MRQLQRNVLDVANSEYIYAKEFSETYSHALGFNLACTGDGGRDGLLLHKIW